MDFKKRYQNGLIMQHKDKHQQNKTQEEKTTSSPDPKETKIQNDLSVLSLESLLKLFCGIDK